MTHKPIASRTLALLAVGLLLGTLATSTAAAGDLDARRAATEEYRAAIDQAKATYAAGYDAARADCQDGSRNVTIDVQVELPPQPTDAAADLAMQSMNVTTTYDQPYRHRATCMLDAVKELRDARADARAAALDAYQERLAALR